MCERKGWCVLIPLIINEDDDGNALYCKCVYGNSPPLQLCRQPCSRASNNRETNKILEHYEKIYLYRRVVKAKLFIDNHFSENIDLDHIAEQACFSKFHFIRLFKSIYGLTPNNYLIKIRIDNAKNYLIKGHSVLETGLLVGLVSPTSFTAMFKKITGQSPSTFQKNENTKRIEISVNPMKFVPNCFAETHGWKK